MKRDVISKTEMTSKELTLLTGRMSTDDIPSVQSRVNKIFLCSAGTDTVTERDAFVGRVYPRLRAYCRDKYGMELQVLDLNWGIPQELIGHQTDMTSLSIQEIQRSLALSSGPNFIAFLGQKYGPLSLPDVILSEEFEAIMLALYGHKGRDTRKADMLERLYDLDDNNIPPVYVLKEKCQIVPELSSSDSSEREVGGAKWEELQTELRALLHKGVELAHLNGSLDSETRDRYLASDLENLTCLGFDSNDDTSKRCVLITRTIADLKNYSQEPRAQYFADVTYNDMEERLELDQVSAEKLDRLKKNLHARIPDSTRIHWEVLWRYEEVIHPQLHKEYLLTLCQQLYEVCVGLIDEDIPVPELTSRMDINPIVVRD